MTVDDVSKQIKITSDVIHAYKNKIRKYFPDFALKNGEDFFLPFERDFIRILINACKNEPNVERVVENFYTISCLYNKFSS